MYGMWSGTALIPEPTRWHKDVNIGNVSAILLIGLKKKKKNQGKPPQIYSYKSKGKLNSSAQEASWKDKLLNAIRETHNNTRQ